jgi:hypothetical protein
MPKREETLLDAIDKAVAADSGEEFSRRVAGFMRATIQDSIVNSSPRRHLGTSYLGEECYRKVWFNWRWASPSKFAGRILRLFNRGHLEEARMAACLEMVGAEVLLRDQETGEQFRFTAAQGHLGGSADGVAYLEGKKILLEFKTHSDSSFRALEKDGVAISKPVHYMQVQTYLGELGMEQALYLAVNKNNDALAAEFISYNQEVHQRAIEKAEVIIGCQEPPPGVSTSPGWWQCRTCNYYDLCHKGEQLAKNCRTCTRSSPVKGGEWNCGSFQIPEHIEPVGCSHYTGVNHRG